VMRMTKRLGLTESSDPVRIEMELNAIVAPRARGALSLRMILHGRRICVARTPRCDQCVLADFCPTAPDVRRRSGPSS
jgi:endonuclease-3